MANLSENNSIRKINMNNFKKMCKEVMLRGNDEQRKVMEVFLDDVSQEKAELCLNYLKLSIYALAKEEHRKLAEMGKACLNIELNKKEVENNSNETAELIYNNLINSYDIFDI
ncbi:hypothetical protein BFS06_11350 [Clostridium perfringens]|uniref:hypothetical protein n=1 Tax=Clostridium perfringens TaxID=1502 RepID=UPI00103B68F2|nr:hypothetical protein [Clostridium perfringens]TBX14810.1 hypothetical protein BFS06_11350 [Clostridium perfringens]